MALDIFSNWLGKIDMSVPLQGIKSVFLMPKFFSQDLGRVLSKKERNCHQNPLEDCKKVLDRKRRTCSLTAPYYVNHSRYVHRYVLSQPVFSFFFQFAFQTQKEVMSLLVEEGKCKSQKKSLLWEVQYFLYIL